MTLLVVFIITTMAVSESRKRQEREFRDSYVHDWISQNGKDRSAFAAHLVEYEKICHDKDIRCKMLLAWKIITDEGPPGGKKSRSQKGRFKRYLRARQRKEEEEEVEHLYQHLPDRSGE